MALTITDTAMHSTDTPHTARWAGDGWTVSWLPPERALNRNEAVTAMTIAEVVGRGGTPGHELMSGDPLWPHIDQWASELGIGGPDAVARASEPPETR
jgi:hypothetical protein